MATPAAGSGSDPAAYPQGQYVYPFNVCPAPRWAGAMISEKGSALNGLQIPPSNELKYLFMVGLRATAPGDPAPRMTPGTVW